MWGCVGFFFFLRFEVRDKVKKWTKYGIPGYSPSDFDHEGDGGLFRGPHCLTSSKNNFVFVLKLRNIRKIK